MEETSPSYFIMDETSGGPHSGSSNKKGFFKKKSSSSTCAVSGSPINNLHVSILATNTFLYYY